MYKRMVRSNPFPFILSYIDYEIFVTYLSQFVFVFFLVKTINRNDNYDRIF